MAGFPDLCFEIVSIGATGEDTVAVEWLMTGTNSAGHGGLPPTGRSVRLPGADLIRTRGDLVGSVVGYFDTASLPRQLGMQVVVQPAQAGPFSFGTAVSAGRAETEPGAVAVTVLEVRSEAEVAEVAERGRGTVAALLGAPGFQAWLGVTAGRRMYTFTAWARPEDVTPAFRANGAHQEAMTRFFAPSVSAAAGRPASGRRTG